MLRESLGESKSSIRDRHAVLSEDSHERTTLPNWVRTGAARKQINARLESRKGTPRRKGPAANRRAIRGATPWR